MSATVLYRREGNTQHNNNIGSGRSVQGCKSSEESVGSASKAIRQLCIASKSVLAWIIVFHAMGAIRAHSDACDGGEDRAYLHEECVGAAERIFSLNTAS